MALPDPPETAGRPRLPTPSQPRRGPRWRGYTAVVLSGGGARGALQVGALRALLEHGIQPDVVVGTSAGAWNGALLARDPSLEGVARMERIWRSITATQVLLGRDSPPNAPAQAITGALMFAAVRRVTRGFPSLYGEGGLRQFLARHIGDLTFEDLRLPLHVIAADITSGTRHIFTSGPLAPALLASASIPGVFPPVRIGSSYYVDGGTLDNCSIETALTLGARRIVVLDVGYDRQPDGAAPAQEWAPVGQANAGRNGTRAHGITAHALAAVLERTTQVMSRYQFERALERIPRGIETHVLRPATPDGGGALDFGQAAAWIESAYAFTREYLAAALPDPQAPSALRADAPRPSLPAHVHVAAQEEPRA